MPLLDTLSDSRGEPEKRSQRGRRDDQLWGGADFTYVGTWQGFAYVAFIIDVFASVIVG